MLVAAFALSAGEPKTFEEKKQIAAEMKKISRQLNVRCEYCHADADRGLREGDYTLLTEEGEYAHEEMFPLSETFKVECSFCHTGASDLNAMGERSHQDMKFMKRYLREKKKKLTCKSCHIPAAAKPFSELTAFGKKHR